MYLGTKTYRKGKFKMVEIRKYDNLKSARLILPKAVSIAFVNKILLVAESGETYVRNRNVNGYKDGRSYIHLNWEEELIAGYDSMCDRLLRTALKEFDNMEEDDV